MARYQADFETAVTYGERALALLGEAADLRNLSRLRGEYGTLMLLARPDDAERARDELQRATREMTATAAGGIDIARCLTELARAEIAMGQPAQGRRPGDRGTGAAGHRAAAGDGRRAHRPGRGADPAGPRGGRRARSWAARWTCLQQMEPSREAAEGWFNLAELLGRGRRPKRGAPRPTARPSPARACDRGDGYFAACPLRQCPRRGRIRWGGPSPAHRRDRPRLHDEPLRRAASTCRVPPTHRPLVSRAAVAGRTVVSPRRGGRPGADRGRCSPAARCASR